MTSALDEEDLALSINQAHTRRGSSTKGRDGSAEEGYQQSSSRAHTFSTPTQSQEQMPQSSPSLVQKTGTHRLDQYEIIKTLGEGSFGKVKLAVHKVSGQKVALKIISRRKLMARDMAGRIEREIQYLQLLRHPHIIKLYTVITTRTEIIMVLEYAGSELFNYIVDHGKMPEDKARKFFQQIVCAVEYCHRHKIVHRDLKPENLLLDEQLHVKIADFGLSNIMTDGNFLKTSCGSPNYAATEVISGKLYAGPEVDVWSCGVILYVLLVGRLPFDDEYIPALFKKIAQGNYHVPHYLSQGAVRLIRKMLQISPVHRITVEEIRRDPWFMKDLPGYLQPAAETFFDTGVDPNRPIDPTSLAPMKPPAEQEKIHNSVVGKLGKTMGYGTEDVKQALAVDEPNAIKDAYLIVRENQIMRTTPSLARDPVMQPFLAGSPPVSSPIASMHEVAHMQRPTIISSQLAPNDTPRELTDRPRNNSGSNTTAGLEARSQVNTIGVLPSSLPDYHMAFMRGQPRSPPSGHELNTSQDSSPKQSSLQVHTSEQQAATVRRLKPHSKSQLNLEKMNRPEGMTPLQPTLKKPRPTKWQFGIRSRNQPAEAMLAIYKALRAMGAEWEVPKARRKGGDRSEHHSADGEDGSVGSISSDAEAEHSGNEDRDVHHNSDSDLDDDHTHPHTPTNDDKRASTVSENASPLTTASYRGRARDRYGSFNDWGYSIPQDPWIINARFRKDGMFPPGVVHPSNSSTNSSIVDLNETSTGRSRRSSTLSSTTSIADTAAITTTPTTTKSAAQTSADGATPGGSSKHGSRQESSSGQEFPSADDCAWVYMTIQLYSIEKEFYLVDFKCAGYERLVRRLIAGKRDGKGDEEGEELRGDGEEDGGKVDVDVDADAGGDWVGEEEVEAEHGGGGGGVAMREEFVGDGRAAEEKDVSSPFPFLDVASRLIIQLAEAE